MADHTNGEFKQVQFSGLAKQRCPANPPNTSMVANLAMTGFRRR